MKSSDLLVQVDYSSFNEAKPAELKAAPNPDQVIDHMLFSPEQDIVGSLNLPAYPIIPHAPPPPPQHPPGGLRCFDPLAISFPVKSIWQIIYLLEKYSRLQGLNKWRQSLDAELMCSDIGAKYFIHAQ